MRGREASERLACALLALLLVAGVARAAGDVETVPAHEPQPEWPTDPRWVLVGSRVGRGFTGVFLRVPVELGLVTKATSESSHGELPVAFAMGRAFPNPFAGSARVPFELPRASHVKLEVLDLAGRVVRTLVDGPFAPGRHSEQWKGT